MAQKYEAELNGVKGVWRTIGGRRVFIRTGQSLSSAMKESGKFPSYKKNKEKRTAEKYDRANDEEAELNKRETAKIREYKEQGMSLEDAVNKANKEFENERDAIINKKAKMVDDLKRKQDVKGAEGKVYTNDAKGEKERAEDYRDRKKQEYLESLNKRSDWGNAEWRKENDKLQNEYYNAEEDYEKKLLKYARKEKGEMSWRDKARLNDIDARNEREKLENETPRYMQNSDEYNDKYYGTYREAERKNAKLKVENPNDKYVNIDAHAGYIEKVEKNWKADSNEMKSAKLYTNDEFMEHLTDANWHTERGMLEDARLTNKQLEYVKNHTMVAPYTADLDVAKTKKLIKEAKEKYPDVNPEAKYTVKSNNNEEKYATAKREGFGEYNKSGVPVYKNKIDYSGDFSQADLKTLSDEEIGNAYGKQKELYEKALSENLGDQRTRNGRMNKIFNTAQRQKYGKGMEILSNEIQKRGALSSISKYQNMFNEYKKLHPNTKMDLQKFARMMMDLD